MTRTGLEPVLPPWKGGVLTAWPTGQDNIKAGDENRTRDNSLEGCSFTTKLHPLIIKRNGARRNRTADTWSFNPLLYQLSYRAKYCGSRIWTYDLRVMSPTSYRAAPSRVNIKEDVGFEPTHAFTRLTVFKTVPFSRTWVILQLIMDLVGLEPTTTRLWAESSNQLS